MSLWGVVFFVTYYLLINRKCRCIRCSYLVYMVSSNYLFFFFLRIALSKVCFIFLFFKDYWFKIVLIKVFWFIVVIWYFLFWLFILNFDIWIKFYSGSISLLIVIILFFYLLFGIELLISLINFSWMIWYIFVLFLLFFFFVFRLIFDNFFWL